MRHTSIVKIFPQFKSMSSLANFFSINSEEAETSDKLIPDTPKSHNEPPKQIVISWLQKNFKSMEFEYNKSTEWSKRKKYNIVSDVYKVIIETDNKESFVDSTLIKKNRIKNKHAIQNGYSIIRIEESNIVSNRYRWDIQLHCYLSGIKERMIKNKYFWIGTSAEALRIYQTHYCAFVKDNFTPYTPEKIETNPNEKTTIYQNTKKILNNIFGRDEYKNMDVDTLFTKNKSRASWLGNSRFTYGSQKYKFVISIDSAFFEKIYPEDDDPSEMRKVELLKARNAIKNGFICIRVYYQMSEWWKEVEQNFLSLLDSVCNGTNSKKLVWFATKNSDYDNVYKQFEKDVLKYI